MVARRDKTYDPGGKVTWVLHAVVCAESGREWCIDEAAHGMIIGCYSSGGYAEVIC